MILNHLWGLHSHPRQEWLSIDKQHENILYGVSHILITGLIPAICSYFSAVYLGWYINFEELSTLSPQAALLTSVAMYILLVSGVFLLALIACKLAHAYGASPKFTQTLELTSYACTPLLICGFTALYPRLWFMGLVGSGGLIYSVYLLFSGVPILINVSEDKRLPYSYALVVCGLMLMFSVAGLILYIWTAQN
jgi:hypothetical protein